MLNTCAMQYDSGYSMTCPLLIVIQFITSQKSYNTTSFSGATDW